MDDPSQPPKPNPLDGQIDFTLYSIAQLKELEYSIDRSAFPKNYENLLAALKGKEQPALEPQAANDPVLGRFTTRSGLLGWLEAKFRRSPVYGAGSIEVSSSAVTLSAWQRTWLGVAIETQRTRDLSAVRNVVAESTALRFEVKRKWLPAEKISFRPADPDQATTLLHSLPVAVTSGFRERWSAIRDFNQKLQGLGGRLWATPVIVLVNILAFGAMSVVTRKLGLFNPQELLAWGANFGPLTVNGQWWRLVTALFVHFNLMHVLVNMWALWNIGRLSERLFGSASLIFLYLASGVLASLTSIAWEPALSSVGASGAIFGIFGAFLAFLWRERRQIPSSIIRRHWVSTLVFVLFNLINGAIQPGIDNAAHVGGFLSGLALGYILARPLDRELRAKFPLVQSLSAVAFISVAVFLALWQVRGIGSELTIPERYAHQHQALVRDELQNLQLWNTLAQGYGTGTISDAEMGLRFEHDILPFWRTQQSRLDSENATVKGPERPYALLVAEFVKVRYEWASAVVAATQNSDSNALAEAKKLLVENNVLQARLDRIGIRASMDHRPRALAAAPIIRQIREWLTGYRWSCVGIPAEGNDKDGPAKRYALGCQAQQLFMSGDYQRLDSLMNRSLDSQADLPDASSSFEGITNGLSDLFTSANLAPEVILGHTADWRRQVKSSVMADLAEAMFFRSWAWAARGSGYAKSISGQNLVAYEYRTEMAAAALSELAERAKNNPLWYTLSLSVGLDQSKDRQELRELFDRGHSIAPDFFPLYRSMLRILMPRWGGSYEEVDKFINDINGHDGKERGYQRYAQLYSMYAQLEGDDLDIFADTPAFWSGMRQGYLHLIKQYPASGYLVNRFANFACRAADKETYSRLRHDLVTQPAPAAWSTKYSVESCDKKLGLGPEVQAAIMDQYLRDQPILFLGGIRLGMTRQQLLAVKGSPVLRTPTYWVYNTVDSRHNGALTVLFSSPEPEARAVVRAIAYSGDDSAAPKELPFLDGLRSAEVLEQFGRQLSGRLTLEGEMTFTFRNGVFVNTHDEQVYRYGIIALPSAL